MRLSPVRPAAAVLLLLATPLAGGCSLLRPATTPLAGTAWHLATLAEPGGTDTVLGPDAGRYTLTFGRDGQANGQGDCNRYFGPYTQAVPDRLTFGPIGATRMACPDLSRESAYLAALGRTTRARLAGRVLTLTADDGTRLTFTAR